VSPAERVARGTFFPFLFFSFSWALRAQTRTTQALAGHVQVVVGVIINTSSSPPLFFLSLLNVERW